MFKKVLIANRGAIACRIQRTLKKLGAASVAVYSEADAGARHVLEADEAYLLGPAPAAESYLRADKILAIAKQCGAEAIHPGYGFLSENPDFADACAAAGIAFVGPTGDQMRAFGLKHTARELAERNGVPLLPGSGLLGDVGHAQAEARRIGYPVMLKSTAGGGGIGMRLIWSEDQLAEAYASVDRLARANFKEAGIYLEKYVEKARHIEVQIFGDGRGKVVALGERDCSVQRRNQKVVEETPAPGLSDRQRADLLATAVRLGEAVNYRSAGTVEFVYDAGTGAFYFLEVNTRLQVEHGVTEEVTGIDLVEWMLRQAADDMAPLDSFRIAAKGAAIQVRLYAEDPNKNFQPSAGLLTAARFPSDIRVDAWVQDGTLVPPNYDPMLAKLIAYGPDRETARSRLIAALEASEVAGIETNRAYLAQVLDYPDFVAGRQITRMLEGFHYRPASVDVLEPGVQSSLQDWPGRTGYWDVGVPPSGPMDALSMRLANRLVGNPEGAAALELTAAGPTLKFNCDAVIALAGAHMAARLDGEVLAYWRAHPVKAGSVLQLGRVDGPGLRTYLAVAGAFQAPDYLGSKATFSLGQFGGHGGRTLRTGDVLHLLPGAGPAGAGLAAALQPELTDEWEIGVLYGPHGAPDFFTAEDVDTFFATAWEVHYNSSRTGVRLIGPKPHWARTDGGEAGLHPSNIHDNAYAIGAVDFTGDMPVILGPDGPSLGGFVCPATIVQAELWKMGQLKPGDRVRFKRLTRAQANALQRAQDAAIAGLDRPACASLPAQHAPLASPVLRHLATEGEKPALVVRQSGDANLLFELGPLVLDMELRFRIQALMEAVKAETAAGRLPGVLDLTPGIRSLQVHFDPRAVDQDTLLDAVVALEEGLPPLDDMEVPSRIVHLPLSWDDPATRLAIEKYMQSVRPDAPWCPSNIEFIRRINGLDSIEDVFNIVFKASYVVMGLGDVYLGAPVATPLDPRHRLVTTKYNPARTWTPENAVGIGGAYLCVYGMEGPGGYQFVGRTAQMWNRHRVTADFAKPWLLRFFDQVRFYPVGQDELLKLREDFVSGRFKLEVEPARFSLREYRRFLADNAESIATFKTRQQAAFEAERERWKAAGQDVVTTDETVAEAGPDSELDLPENARPVASHVAGSVWKVEAKVGDLVQAGQTLVIVESMKMEFALVAPCAGRLSHLFCKEGGAVSAGQDLLVIEEAGQ
ncbi:urea carboxylase [Parasulfuritortus cantonensis]|uniref:Urea carboxylase n=1 Tax=Parasulfuritortus cantonensis TaxID=2528202 RepID=A0A4R1BD69_9PROT|nr:urea carboxylase [Parasulfuritortus cantonensis]TCJ14957.1 urea carboxylase [Parasulfuritortus cantonensis]